MSTLVGRNIKDTYKDFLRFENSGAGIDSTLRFVEDGLGNQLPIKISDTRLQLAANLDLNSNKIVNLTDPTAAQDAATKSYVDTTNHGYKNWIQNPQFAIWQRHNTFTDTGNFCADRWVFVRTGGAVTLTKNELYGTQPTVGTSSLWFNIDTKPTGECYIYQNLHDDALFTLTQKPITLSFWVFSSVATDQTPVNVTVKQYFGDGGGASADVDTTVGSYTITQVGVFEKKTFTFTPPSVVGKTLGTDPIFQVKIALPLQHITPATGSIHIAGVQMEIGSVATPFEFRPLGLEMQLCQRYFQKSYDYNEVPGTASSGTRMWTFPATATMFTQTIFPYHIEMRKIPIVTIYSFNGTAGFVTNDGAHHTAVVEPYQNHMLVYISGSSLTGGTQVQFSWTASAE